MKDTCSTCGDPVQGRDHDHKPDGSGLDDGPYLPGHGPRKRPLKKSTAEYQDTRARAWATRRLKYGARGHR
jgi:hypothetical protein